MSVTSTGKAGILSITSTGNAGILPANKTKKTMHAGKMPAFPVEVTALMVRLSGRGGSLANKTEKSMHTGSGSLLFPVNNNRI